MHPGIFVHRIIPISDSPLQNLIQHFPACYQFIQSAREQGGSVLVHCNGGISRAPAVAVAYLMESQGWDYSNAYSWVQNIRFCINPNVGFKHQLQEYEPIYKARNARMASDSQHLKRAAEFE